MRRLRKAIGCSSGHKASPPTRSPALPADQPASALTASDQAATAPGYRPAYPPAAGKATGANRLSPAAPHSALDTPADPTARPRRPGHGPGRRRRASHGGVDQLGGAV